MILAHLLCSSAGEPAFREVLEPLGYQVSRTPTSFAETLGALERCNLLIVDTDLAVCGEVYFALGYAVARGKTVLGVGESRPFLLDDAAVIVGDLAHFKRAVRSFRDFFHSH